MIPSEFLQSPAVLAAPEGDFDRLTRLAVRVVGATAGLISLLDDEGVFNVLCREVIATGGPLLVDDAGAHPTLHTDELVSDLEIRGFAGFPLINHEGRALGALCVVDMRPRRWTDDECELLSEVASAAVTRLGLRSALAHASEAAAERKAVVDSSPDCIVVMDSEGLIREWNPAAERTFGWTRDEAAGRSLREMIVPEEFRKRQTDGLARAVRTSVSQMVGQRLRLPAVRKDGSFFTAEIAVTKLERSDQTFFLGTVRDVTEIVRAEAELTAAAEERYRSLIETIPLVTYMNSVEEPFGSLYMSPQVESLLGYTQKEWAAHPELARDSIHPDDRERIAAVTREAREQGVPTRSEFRFIARDGRIVWVLDQTIPVRDADGEITCHQGFLLDITEQKELGEQLRQSQKMDAIGQLAGGVAHDFNNMLTAITGYAELLGYSFDEGDPRLDDVGELKRAAAHAASLTRQLLAFSRKQMLLPRRLDVNEIVSELEPILRRTIGEQIAVELELGPGLAQVEVDQDQLTQVVLNIALNARDAMPDGGLLRISTAAAGADVEISIADTGTGIDAATLDHIFEPFFTTKDTGKGTGLGLATVYGVVSQSGGRIEVDSAPGAGSTFRVLLPQAPALSDRVAA